MIETENNEEILVKDLKEGDIALLKYSEYDILVYVFKESPSSPLVMVSISHKRKFWHNVSNIEAKISRILEDGEKLIINNKKEY